MLAFVPLELEQPVDQPTIPTANAVLIAANVVVFGLTWSGPWVLGPGTGMLSVLSYGFCHLGFWHLVTNMWALLVFGNPVNRRLGNGYYLAAYLGTLVALGLIGKLFLRGSYMAGASGAVFAVIAIALMLMPAAKLRLFYVALVPLTILIGIFSKPEHWLDWFIRWGRFSIRAVWCLILIPLLQLWFFIRHDGDLSYLAHLLGMLAGLAVVLLLPPRISMGARATGGSF